MVSLCNFHSHSGGELPDSEFVDVPGNENRNVYFQFVKALCNKYLKDKNRAGYLVMDVMVQLIYIYSQSLRADDGKLDPRFQQRFNAAEAKLKEITSVDLALQWILERIAELQILYKNTTDQKISDNQQQVVNKFCMRAIKKTVRATKTTLFDDAYVARGIYFSLKDEDVATYALTMRNKQCAFMNQSNHYLELSLDADEYYAGNSKYLEPNIFAANNRVMLLHMTNKHHKALATEDKFAELELYQVVDTFERIRADDVAAARQLIGIDWLAPEGYQFDAGRTLRIVGRFLDKLNACAERLCSHSGSQRLVFRPHIGEGCSVFNGDQSATPLRLYPRDFMVNAWGAVNYFIPCFDAQHDGSGLERYVIGEFQRYMGGDDFAIGGRKYAALRQRALNNTRVMVQAIGDWIDNHPQHKLLFRLGHVTHCDAATAGMISKFGIYADVNLGSNIRTGALNTAPGLGAVDYVRMQLNQQRSDKLAYNSLEVFNGIKALWGQDAYQDSGLHSLLNAHCNIVLGDDGAGSEGTELRAEYQRFITVASELCAVQQNSQDAYKQALDKTQQQWLVSLFGQLPEFYSTLESY